MILRAVWAAIGVIYIQMIVDQGARLVDSDFSNAAAAAFLVGDLIIFGFAIYMVFRRRKSENNTR